MSLPIDGGGGLGSICARAEVAPRATAARVALASRRTAEAKGDLLLDMIVLLDCHGPLIGPCLRTTLAADRRYASTSNDETQCARHGPSRDGGQHHSAQVEREQVRCRRPFRAGEMQRALAR